MRSCLELRESVSRSGSPEKAGTDLAAWAGSCCWILQRGSRTRSVRGGGAAPSASYFGQALVPRSSSSSCFLCPGCSMALSLIGEWLGTGVVPKNRWDVMQRDEKLREAARMPQNRGRGLGGAAQGGAAQGRAAQGRAGRMAGQWQVLSWASATGTAGTAIPCPPGWPRWLPFLHMAVDACR